MITENIYTLKKIKKATSREEKKTETVRIDEQTIVKCFPKDIKRIKKKYKING